MEETKGLSVAEKKFEFTFPVSGEKFTLRYATRKDKKDAILNAGKGEDAEEKFELNYLSFISGIEIPVLEKMVEKDFNFLRLADNKVNNVSQEEMDKLVRDFATAQK